MNYELRFESIAGGTGGQKMKLTIPSSVREIEITQKSSEVDQRATSTDSADLPGAVRTAADPIDQFAPLMARQEETEPDGSRMVSNSNSATLQIPDHVRESFGFVRNPFYRGQKLIPLMDEATQELTLDRTTALPNLKSSSQLGDSKGSSEPMQSVHAEVATHLEPELAAPTLPLNVEAKLSEPESVRIRLSDLEFSDWD